MINECIARNHLIWQGNVHEIFPGYRKGDEVLLREKVAELLAEESETASVGTD